MNKALVFAGIAVVVISKVTILKSILIDSPAYQRCVSDGPASLAQACGTDPFAYFILGWFVTVGGFVLLVFGLKMPSTSRSISRWFFLSSVFHGYAKGATCQACSNKSEPQIKEADAARTNKRSRSQAQNACSMPQSWKREHGGQRAILPVCLEPRIGQKKDDHGSLPDECQRCMPMIYYCCQVQQPLCRAFFYSSTLLAFLLAFLSHFSSRFCVQNLIAVKGFDRQ